MVDVEDWIAVVKDHVGVKVKHRGFSRTTGVDCSGLMISSLGEVGIRVVRPFLNGTLPHESQVTSAMREYAKEVTTLRPGVIIQTLLGRQGRHLGVYIGDNDFGQKLWIHAKGSSDKVVTSIFTGVMVRLWEPNGIEY